MLCHDAVGRGTWAERHKYTLDYFTVATPTPIGKIDQNEIVFVDLTAWTRLWRLADELFPFMGSSGFEVIHNLTT